MRNGQHSTVCKGSPDSLLYEGITGCVHVAGGFVKDQNFGFAQESSCHAQQLPLA